MKEIVDQIVNTLQINTTTKQVTHVKPALFWLLL